MHYRPEIDGLRALAVLAVLGYHVKIGLPAGFLGVDIFLVISGYLITEKILSARQRGRFGFLAFYWRRAQRLLPALYLTLAGTTLTAAILLPRPRVEMLLKELPFAATFASNIFFWTEGSSVDLLLHTWSLSLEGQFYLLWPFVILTLCRVCRGPASLRWALGAVSLLSVFSAHWMSAIDQRASFYLLPFRVFEFSMGALCATVPQIQVKDRGTRWALSFLVALFLFVPMGLLSIHSPLPGLATLIPCTATAVILATEGLPFHRLLSLPILRPVGLASYSIYLLHWPVILFFLTWSGTPLALPHQIGLSVVSLVLGWLSWRYVETPFHRRTNRPLPIAVSLRSRSRA